METAQPVVEDGQRAVRRRRQTTRSRSRSSSRSSAAMPVCGASPPLEGFASGHGMKAIERPSSP